MIPLFGRISMIFTTRCWSKISPGSSNHIQEYKWVILYFLLIRVFGLLEMAWNKHFLFPQIDHVARVINLPQEIVEKKLSQMILDKVLPGILDQGAGVIVLYEENPVDKTYESALETAGHFNKALDALFQRAKKLAWTFGIR